MRIHEKRILPIRLIRIRQPLPQNLLLLLPHPRQNRLILPIQAIITEPQRHAHEDLRRQTRDDRDLTALVAGCFGTLERLRAQDIANTEGDERQGVDGDFL